MYLKSVEPREIEEGDVVAFSITGAKRARYNYPSTIIHRVVNIEERDGTLWFQTAGDKTGKDPFKIVEYNARSKFTGFKIPRVGLALLFLNTGQGRMWLLFSGVFLLSLKFVPDAWEGWRENKEKTESIHEGVEKLKETAGRPAAEGSDIVMKRDEYGDVSEVRREGAGGRTPGDLNLVRNSAASNAQVGGGQSGE
ncbi:hypothetical protein AKJ51_01835 [candidate division MSBL1 archaeon SCGC-AAA382A20]|uniref:Signal peptidase I n=1 Tax=candidate division MSBL1 archaeon SCGC-AAA382A20 TaxID=1698280 RepID=A0A133VL98_9EURY|nr:hypothetical protein AKJ51_01835 [candidate division MSBL1 archaeon SCGC-AAA382A20]